MKILAVTTLGIFLALAVAGFGIIGSLLLELLRTEGSGREYLAPVAGVAALFLAVVILLLVGLIQSLI